MATRTKEKSEGAVRGYPDLQEHLKALDAAGLLVTIDEPINKDTEMHPLVPVGAGGRREVLGQGVPRDRDNPAGFDG